MSGRFPLTQRGGCVRTNSNAPSKRLKVEGKSFFANATAGTTVMGAYDPLEEIADIGQAYGLWFHVDASWGGSVVFSDKYRFRLNGAERANSLTVNPHKVFGVPVTCSFLLTSDLRKFHRANSLPAGYLFHDVVEASREAD